MRKSARVFIPSTALKYTLPPLPPSPPSGPPRGTNFSRRKLMHPAPPLPALTEISVSSTNMRRGSRRGGSGGCVGDADVLGVASPLELHVAVVLGVEGIVRPASDVHARLE